MFHGNGKRILTGLLSRRLPGLRRLALDLRSSRSGGTTATAQLFDSSTVQSTAFRPPAEGLAPSRPQYWLQIDGNICRNVAKNMVNNPLTMIKGLLPNQFYSICQSDRMVRGSGT
jgi:hypothetical protein